MKHLKKEPKVLNVIRIIIIMNRKPKQRMRRRIIISHNPTVHPRRNQNGRFKTSRPLGGHQPEVVVPLHILLLEFVELLHAVDAELLHFFSEVFGRKFGNVALGGFTVAVGGDEVVRFAGAEDFVEAEGEVGHCSCGGMLLGAAAGRQGDSAEMCVATLFFLLDDF